MTIDFTVRANVVDIVNDKPLANEAFLIDTNVWYWVTYPNASLGALAYQIRSYPNYIKQAITARAFLFYSGLSFAELAHLIERTEMEIFKKRSAGLKALKVKMYRHHYPNERTKVIAEVQNAWDGVKAMGNLLNTTINESTVNSSLTRFTREALDGYDLFFIETMQQEGISSIITDDGDYSTVEGITVFTANLKVIEAAKKQGRLIKRYKLRR